MEESLVDIIGFDGLYMVSNTGKVKSYDRIIFNPANGSSYTLKGRILKQYFGHNGYTTGLTDNYGVRKTHLVSNLMYFSFNPKDVRELYKQEISFLDKNHYNLNLNNLALVSVTESKKLCYNNGIILNKKANKSSKDRGDSLMKLDERVCVKCGKSRPINKFKETNTGRVSRKTCLICKVNSNKKRRRDSIKKEILNLGCIVIEESREYLKFLHDNEAITFFYDSGVYKGKKIKGVKGFKNLLKNLKEND